MKKSHYYKTTLKKLGVWALLPADCGSWHGLGSSKEFRKEFGLGKGLLMIHETDTGSQIPHAPIGYLRRLEMYLERLRRKSPKNFEKKFKKFYTLRSEAKKSIPKLQVGDYAKLSDAELANLYKVIRHWIHRVTIYDQIGWLSEEYWNRPMDNVLVMKLKLEKGSAEYNKILFTLTKPEEISTTLEEKREVLKKVLDSRRSLPRTTIRGGNDKGSQYLAKKYGWMPVFTYGEPWDEKHYEKELSELRRQPRGKLRGEYQKLRDYTKIRNQDIKSISKKYNLTQKDIQVFVDFGLALDTRNEAEYVLSFGSYYLLPIYKEAAKRLHVSERQLRLLEETEIVDCLQGKKNIDKLLDNRRRLFVWGFNLDMSKQIFFGEEEATKLYRFVKKHAQVAVDEKMQRGITASPGKVTGRARIVLSPADNHKVKPGDILITTATTVDYLPAMKRAAAFVAEVGGLTCHAAVVAREFGVPCIVSLKNVTKKFKDGDLVELDANKGLVKKV